MKIAVLEPDIAQVVCSLGLAEQVVAVSADCNHPALAEVARVTSPIEAQSRTGCFEDLVCSGRVDMARLKALAPDVIVSRIPRAEPDDAFESQLCGLLRSELGSDLAFHSFNPTTLEMLYGYFEDLGKVLEKPAKGRELASRLKAQFMDWCDNFYDRMKNKRVTFLSSVEPLKLAGGWLPDLIHLASAVSQVPAAGKADTDITWEDVLQFRPDVIVIAPRGALLADTMKSFPAFEKRQGWDSIPAVKRGEVVFADGAQSFYRASLDLIESMAVLISAIGGLESGYITKRDSFYRLRWLELHRHRI